MKFTICAAFLFSAILCYSCHDKYSGKAGTPSDTTSMKYADTAGRETIPTPPANQFNGRRDSANPGSDSPVTELRDSLNKKKFK